MHRETKATAITPATKKAVWERDCGRCVFCGSINAGPHCHFIRRSHGGMGIEQNIWTGCDSCHEEFDKEPSDGPKHMEMKSYLKGWYPGWDEADLVYKKYGGNIVCLTK